MELPLHERVERGLIEWIRQAGKGTSAEGIPVILSDQPGPRPTASATGLSCGKHVKSGLYASIKVFTIERLAACDHFTKEEGGFYWECSCYPRKIHVSLQTYRCGALWFMDRLIGTANNFWLFDPIKEGERMQILAHDPIANLSDLARHEPEERAHTDLVVYTTEAECIQVCALDCLPPEPDCG